jgi:capsule polysaccharide export protein KpsE/RkpR
VKQTNEFRARVVEAPESEPESTAYLVEQRALDHDGAEWLWLLWERRRFLARVTVWGLVLSTVVAFLIPKRYESTTRLMPPDTQSSSGMAMMAALAGKAGAGLSALTGDLLGIKNSSDLFLDILSGRTVQDRLVDRFDLRRVYWDRYWEDARKDLSKRTSVSADRKSGVLTITVTDRDPHRAQQMAQAYVEELDRLVAQVSTSSARRERIFIEQRLKTVKSDLDTASQQFSDYASKNGTIDVTAQGKAMVEGAARLDGELIAAKSELEGLEQIYTANNARVRSLRARVDELQRQLHQLGGDIPGSASDSDVSGVQQEFPSIRKLPQLAVRWTDLYRQTKIEETVYELLTQQYELAKIEEAKEIPVVKVLDASDMPEKKSFPPRALIIGLGVAFSLCLGGLLVVGSQAWKSIDPDSPRKQLLTEIWQHVKVRIESVRSLDLSQRSSH